MNNVFIIAEISANHGNSIQIVKDSILKAKEIGADAVKIQTYTADTITLDVDNEYFVINDDKSLWNKKKLYDLYEEGSIDWKWHTELYEYANEVGITLFSTPFDFTAVDLLEECNNPIYKIASFEITDIPLIKYAASKQKPMIISTGIASMSEIQDAIDACYSVGNNDVTILKCTSEYPSRIEDANLIMIEDMKNKFNVKVGLSDHTIGCLAPIVAVSLGATVIEKHFILDRSIGGPDASFSMDTIEFKEMVDQIRMVEKSIGKVDYDTVLTKKSRGFRRSLFISADVNKGDLISSENIKSVRPGDGLEPKYYEEILNKKFNDNYKKGTPLKKDFFK